MIERGSTSYGATVPDLPGCVAVGASLDAAIDSGWVTAYTDTPPTRHADLDRALAICAFFRVQLEDFVKKATPEPTAEAPRLTRSEARALRLLQRMNEEGQRLAVKTIAGYADVFPRRPSQDQLRNRTTCLW